jgi:tetraacyldisaccharide 4'-kinase
MEHRRSIILYPLSLLYGLITSFRNFLYDSGILKTVEFDIPVICVGNLTVGGTGKTPHTEYLINLLEKNFRVAVLSRGYKRKTRGFRYAESSSRVNEIGDEPVQISRKFPGIILAVDSNRVRGVNKILKDNPGTEVIILDDAYQHRRITPGFSILLTDYKRLIINDTMLPYGNLRENVSNMNRANIILVTKSPEDISPIQRRIVVKDINKSPYQNLYFTSVTYSDPVPLSGQVTGSMDLDSEEAGERGIVLVTGIANPGPLFEYLEKRSGEIIHLSYGDHHRFTENDLVKITEAFSNLKQSHKYVITTEKDAARLREFTNIAEQIFSSFFYIPVGIKFLNDDKDEFDNLIVDYVRKNKRNNRFSQIKRDK